MQRMFGWVFCDAHKLCQPSSAFHWLSARRSFRSNSGPLITLYYNPCIFCLSVIFWHAVYDFSSLQMQKWPWKSNLKGYWHNLKKSPFTLWKKSSNLKWSRGLPYSIVSKILVTSNLTCKAASWHHILAPCAVGADSLIALHVLWVNCKALNWDSKNYWWK